MSLALYRPNRSKELAQLADQHLQHDLLDSDRDALKVASQKFSTYTGIGSLLGLGLGIAMALRIRSVRAEMFKTFRAMERPVSVMFKDGRTETLPDLTNILQPSTFGDIAAYFFFSAGGLFIGGETGLLIGSYSARSSIMKDEESRKRIENAFKSFKVDVLKKEIAALEGHSGELGKDGKSDGNAGGVDMWGV